MRRTRTTRTLEDALSDDPRTGTEPEILGDRYELIELVGVGGVAEVWRAHDRRLRRDVAVKILSGPAARDPVHRNRIEREARAMAAVSHPNVVGVYDYGEQPAASGEPVPYIVLELVDGPDLARRLTEDGAMSPDVVVDLLQGILAGAEQVHRIGIVHGDLKPANILLSADGPKVGDFGVARILAEETGTTVVAATPAYAPPEVFRGERATASSDVYSAACIAYQALTGKPPFDGQNFWELGTQHREAPIPSASAARPDVPARVDEAIRRAMAKDPEHRPAGAAAFAALLEARPPSAAAEDPQATRAAPSESVQTQTMRPPPTETLPAGPRRRFGWRRPSIPAGGIVATLRKLPPGVAIAILAVAALVLMRDAADATVRVPRLEGLTAEQAGLEAERRGFDVEVVAVDAGGKAGTVVDQRPGAGDLARKGTAVVLSVTNGVPQVKVPDVTGEDVQKALDVLVGAGLRPDEVILELEASGEPGTVVRTEPPAGAEVDTGSAIDVVVVPERAEGGDAGGDDDGNRKRGKGRSDD